MADADPRIPPDPRNRVSHYGSQPISSVRGLEGQLSKKQDADPNLEVLAAHVVPQTGQMYIPAYVHPLNSEDGPQLQWKRIGPNPKDIADNQTAASLNPIAIGSGSTTFTVATRTALAQAKTSLASLTLTEAGREGIFVWDGSNLSAKVAADPNQGVYVAPSSAPTGANGAWVRKYVGRASVRWFGAVGDDTINDGPAFLAALSYVNAVATAAGSYGYAPGRSAPGLFIPAGRYFLGTNSLDLTTTTIIEGEGNGAAAAQASVLRWSAGATGLRVQFQNTSGDTTSGLSLSTSGAGSIIRNLQLYGGYNGSNEADFHALLVRAPATIEEVFIDQWQGEGIRIIGDGPTNNGNADLVRVQNCWVQRCRTGLYCSGGDANVCMVTSVSSVANRQWGIRDNGFLGNTFLGCHTSANVSGAYKSENANGRSIFLGCYSEGDQPTSQFVYPTLVIGGTHGAGVSGVSWLNAEQGLRAAGNFNVDGSLVVRGANTEIGPQVAALDSTLYLDNNNFNSFIQFRKASGPGVYAFIQGSAGFGFINNVSAGLSHRFSVTGTGDIHITDSTGLNLQTGMALKYNGAAVLTAGVLTAAAFPALTGAITTVAGSLATTLAANAVTYAKMQTVTAARLLGNPTGGAAVPSEVSLSADLAFSGTALQVGAFTGDITKAAGSLATTIAANAVTFAKMQALSAGGKVVGSAVGNTAIAELTVGTGLTVATSTLRMANISAVTLLGNPTGGATTPSEITLAGGLTFSGTTLTAAGALTPTSVASTGAVTSSGATSGIGYATGAGGAVTQLTSRTTGVTLNKASGAITLFSTTTAAAQFDSFVVTNSAVAATDTVNICVKTATGKYVVTVLAVGAGSFTVGVYTPAAVGSAEAPVLNFAVIKAVAA